MEGDREQEALLWGEDLQVGYRGQALLPPVSFRIGRGEFWGLLGPNGSGKTTMLRTLLGLLPPVAGRVVHSPGMRLAYVPQRSELEDRLPGRVLDVVADGADRGWSFLRPRFLQRPGRHVRSCLEAVGAWTWRQTPFSHLSEGQKQRVQVATALVSDPDLLVLDEPTAAMDTQGEHGVFDLLEELIHQRNLSVLVVSHQTALVRQHASHLIRMDREAGAVEVLRIPPPGSGQDGPVAAGPPGEPGPGDAPSRRRG